jgi:hypothetical protein
MDKFLWHPIQSTVGCQEINYTQAEVVNALSCLAAPYNDYEGFTPHHAMVAYFYDAATQTAIKKIHMSQARMSGLILPLILMTLSLQFI